MLKSIKIVCNQNPTNFRLETFKNKLQLMYM